MTKKLKLSDICTTKGIKQIDAATTKKIITKPIGEIRLLPGSWQEKDLFCSYEDVKEIKKYIYNDDVVTLCRARHPNIKKHSGLFISSNNICIRIKQEYKKYIDFNYFFHFLNKNKDKLYIETGTYPKLDLKILFNLTFFLPSIEKQKEIANILNKFTELTAELTARKKQYEYYRNKLLDFDKEKDDGGGGLDDILCEK